MGADLYINEIFEPNQTKYDKAFRAAVAERDAIDIPNDVSGKIQKQIADALGKEVDFFGPMLDLPANMELPEDLEAYREQYGEYVKAQNAVSENHNKMYEVGYFRDSYNGTSLFWRLGLSWWGLAEEGVINDGIITPENAQMLLDTVESIDLEPVDLQWLEENHCKVDDGPDSWNEFFAEKKERFIAFLKEAIDNGYNITASV